MNFNQQNNPYKQIFKSLKSIYSNKESTYRDIRDYIAPGTGLFDGSVNKANVENDKIDYQKILDSEPTTYMKLTVAGLYGGLVNPQKSSYTIYLLEAISILLYIAHYLSGYIMA